MFGISTPLPPRPPISDYKKALRNEHRWEIAVAAMQGFRASLSSLEAINRAQNTANRKGITLEEWVAQISFAQADAMLDNSKRKKVKK